MRSAVSARSASSCHPGDSRMLRPVPSPATTIWIEVVLFGDVCMPDYLQLLLRRAPRAMACGSLGLQVVSGVGEVEALVDQREVRDDRVGQSDGQRRPGEDTRVDDLHPGQPMVRTDLAPVHDRAAPALDHPDTGRTDAGPPAGPK